MLIAAITGCWFAGNAPLCTGCVSEPVSLPLADGNLLEGRLYLPPGARRNLPAVAVVHGYLGNRGFVEVPWVADVMSLGAAALVLDRPGHRASGGRWWPVEQHGDIRLSALAPDIRAAVAYLRGRAPLVDPARIALVGHSDGGTAAIVAASADWDIAATVSLSASVAPWEYVSHRAPRNLLLIYGEQDRFILAETDLLLIDAATRGNLHRDGMVGALADGSARRLLRVSGYGHLDILYSDVARQTALAWVAQAMRIDREVRLSPVRWPWVVAGLLLLVALVFVWSGTPTHNRDSPLTLQQWLIRGGKVAAIVLLWSGGLALGSWIAPRMCGVPAQEGSIVAGVLLGTGACMSALAIPLQRSLRLVANAGLTATFASFGHGAVAGLLVVLVAEALLRPIYGFPLTGQRLALFGLFILPATPAFAAACAAINWIPSGEITRGVPVEWALAGITAAVATSWFVRMSALPIVLLACTLVFVGAYRRGGRPIASAAAFGAVMYARLAADVCAFY